MWERTCSTDQAAGLLVLRGPGLNQSWTPGWKGTWLPFIYMENILPVLYIFKGLSGKPGCPSEPHQPLGKLRISGKEG